MQVKKPLHKHIFFFAASQQLHVGKTVTYSSRYLSGRRRFKSAEAERETEHVSLIPLVNAVPLVPRVNSIYCSPK